jgi:hypothetical protein
MKMFSSGKHGGFFGPMARLLLYDLKITDDGIDFAKVFDIGAFQ